MLLKHAHVVFSAVGALLTASVLGAVCKRKLKRRDRRLGDPKLNGLINGKCTSVETLCWVGIRTHAGYLFSAVVPHLLLPARLHMVQASSNKPFTQSALVHPLPPLEFCQEPSHLHRKQLAIQPQHTLLYARAADQ